MAEPFRVIDVADSLKSVTTPPSPFVGTTSPFAEGGLTADNLIVELTEAGNAKLKEMRDIEPEGDRLGLRIEVVSGPGEDFRYDLSFEIVTQAAFTDEVRTIDGLKIIILIGGGTKKRQQQDIDRAVALWEDYKRRKASTAKGK